MEIDGNFFEKINRKVDYPLKSIIFATL